MQGMNDESLATQRDILLLKNYKKDCYMVRSGNESVIKNYVYREFRILNNRFVYEDKQACFIARLRLMNELSDKIIEKKQAILDSKGIKDKYSLFKQEKNKAIKKVYTHGAISILAIISGIYVNIFGFDDSRYNVAGNIFCCALSFFFLNGALENGIKATDIGQTKWLTKEQEKYKKIKNFIS